MLTVSDTAYAIATVRARERELPEGERLFDDPYASVFVAAGAHAAEATARLLELPMMRDAVRLRTRFIDDCVRDALASASQVLLLGAGFDARALRMPEIAAAGARVYEVDFPALLEHKRALLADAGITLPAHVSQVPCDFMDPHFEAGLSARLEASGFRRGAGVLVVWEGVLAYIDAAAIERSLDFMTRRCGSGTRLAFDYSDYGFVGAPMADRLKTAGFDRFESTGFDALWRQHLRGEPPPSAVAIKMGVSSIE